MKNTKYYSLTDGLWTLGGSSTKRDLLRIQEDVRRGYSDVLDELLNSIYAVIDEGGYWHTPDGDRLFIEELIIFYERCLKMYDEGVYLPLY